MNIDRFLTAAALSLGMTASAIAPAQADGAASTRNILIGGAAAAAGTLLIINHNKQVHQRYADDARRQATAESQASNAQAAYAAERRAYDNEVALNAEYRHEVATQHGMIESLRRQVASNRSHAAVAARPRGVAIVPRRNLPSNAAHAPTTSPTATRVATDSWGWGQL